MTTRAFPSSLPYLTAGYPGIGGVIRAEPEDFQVEERPLYLPSGEGEHLYVRITKRGLSTPDLVKTLADTLGVKRMHIGVAGLKDARAVTTQMVSLWGARPEMLPRLRHESRILTLEVLGRHRHRLRTGHHAGNAFHVTVRDVSSEAEAVASVVLEEARRRGVPNYFGPQRQGRDGDNYELGRALLRDPARRTKLGKSKAQWYLNTFQSYLFNRMVAARIATLDRLLEGDWAVKHVNGACFPVTDVAAEQPRADRFEISPTGILFGSRAPWATGEAGAIERAVIADDGLTPESLTEAGAACRFRGERRPLRIPLTELDWSLTGNRLTLRFVLPSGAYATSVLRELMKADQRA
jgi:tRNA pseudouridine13 synthase